MDKKKLFIIIGAVLLVLIIIIILILPKEKPQELSIKKIVMAKGETEDKQAINPAEIFSTEDPEIHAIITYAYVPAGTAIQYQWYSLDLKETLKSETRRTSVAFSGNTTSSIKKSEKLSWDAGNFEFRVWLAGELIAQKRYVVKTPAEIKKTQILTSIKKISLTTSVDLRGNPTANPTDIFDIEDKKIYASVAYENVPSGTKFEGRWVFEEENKLIDVYKKTLSGDGVFAFAIDASKDSWIPVKKWVKGKYRLVIYLNGDLFKEILFTVE